MILHKHEKNIVNIYLLYKPVYSYPTTTIFNEF